MLRITTSHSSLDVWDTSQLVSCLTELWCLARFPCVVRVRLAITNRLQEGLDEGLESHGPVAVTVLCLEKCLLADQVFLSCC